MPQAAVVTHKNDSVYCKGVAPDRNVSGTLSTIAQDLKLKKENIDKISLLRLEYEALKKTSKNMSESKYAVLSEMLEISTLSKNEKADVLVDVAEILWLNSNLNGKRTSAEYLDEASQLLESCEDVTALAVLGKVKLWLFIIGQETFCRKIKEKLNAVNDFEDEEIDDENRSEDEKKPNFNRVFQMNEFNISMEVNRLSVLDSAVDCWYKALICGKADEVVNKESWLRAVRLCSQIYQLINQHFQALKVHGMAVLLARMVCSKEDFENSILKIVDTLITLGYTNPAASILTDIEKNILPQEGNQLDRNKLHLRRAKLLFCDKKTSAAMELLEEIIKYTSSRNVKDKTCCLIEGSSMRLMSVFAAMSDSVGSSQPTDLYAVNLANGAVRLHTGVRLYISGKENFIDFVDKWLITHESLESLLNLGQISLYIGAAREAKCYLKEGLKLAREMGLVNWSIQFLIELTKIYAASGDKKDALLHLSSVQNMLSHTAAESNERLLDTKESGSVYNGDDKIEAFRQSLCKLSSFCHDSQCRCSSCKDFFLQSLLLQHYVNLAVFQSENYHMQDFDEIFDSIHKHFRCIASGEFTGKFIYDFIEMIEKYPVLDIFHVLKKSSKQLEMVEYFNPVFLKGFLDMIFIKIDSIVLVNQFESALNLAHCGLTLLQNNEVKFGSRIFFYVAKFQWYIVQITLRKNAFDKMQTKQAEETVQNSPIKPSNEDSTPNNYVVELENEFEQLNLSNPKCEELTTNTSQSTKMNKIKTVKVKSTSVSRNRNKKYINSKKSELLNGSNICLSDKAMSAESMNNDHNFHLDSKIPNSCDMLPNGGEHKFLKKTKSCPKKDRSKGSRQTDIKLSEEDDPYIIPGTPPQMKNCSKQSRIPRPLHKQKHSEPEDVKKTEGRVKFKKEKSSTGTEKLDRKCQRKSTLKGTVEKREKGKTSNFKTRNEKSEPDPYVFDPDGEEINKKTKKSTVKNTSKACTTRKSTRRAKTVADETDNVERLRTSEETSEKVFVVSPVKIREARCRCKSSRNTGKSKTVKNEKPCDKNIVTQNSRGNKDENVCKKTASNTSRKVREISTMKQKITNCSSQKSQTPNHILNSAHFSRSVSPNHEITLEDHTADISTEIIRSARTTSSMASCLHHSSAPKEVENSKVLEDDFLATNDADMIILLEQSFNLVRYFPPVPLYSSICKQLALHFLESSALKCAYFLTESVALTFRHHCIYNLSKKIRKISKEGKRVKNELVGKVSTLSKLNQKIEDLSFNKEEHHVSHIVESLPQHWTVCQVTMIDDLPGPPTLLVTRFEKSTDPLVLKLPAFDTIEGRSVLTEFSSILEASAESMKIKEKVTWWTLRRELNDRLHTLTENMDKYWMGSHKGCFIGKPKDTQKENQLINALQQKIQQGSSRKIEKEKIKVFLRGMSFLSDEDIRNAVMALTELENCSPCISTICEFLKKEQLKFSFDEEGDRHPVILILDKAVQHLPWESVHVLRKQTVTRIPSLYFLSAHLNSIQDDSTSVFSNGVNSEKTFYILNPDGNLSGSQDTFQDWFSKKNGWNGITGRPPSREEYLTALSDHDLLIYCGHGSGSKYLDGDSIQQSECRAVTILMGCSSGNLQVKGQLDPSGIVLNYLTAGCCCVIGNLWDVTDRDIDKFLDVLLQNWLEKKTKPYLTDNIAIARESCKLPYLIGAAPVVYGLPVYLSL